MGIGSALSEAMVVEEGEVKNSDFLDYKVPSSLDVPSGENVHSMMAPAPHHEGPYGAKGFSEGALVTVAPAIGNAIFNATGVRIHDLPITKEKVAGMLRTLAKNPT